jgi:MtN3 and saliva related transmembrane protein
MESTTFLGLLAGTLTTFSFLPQVVKTWRTKSTKDISLGMFVTFCAGVFLWLVYGILIHDLPVIITNFVTLILASSILWMKLKYKPSKR